MRLVICDANRLLCEALGAVLQARDHEVVAIVSSADDCVTAVTTYKPDVCLLDVRIPRPEDGLRSVREIRSECPGTAVLVLSALSDRRTCSQARKLGVAGFMGKDRSVNQITAALDMIIDGEAVFDQGPPREPPSTATPVDLTPREAEVLRRLAAGQDTRRMASEMNVTVSTLRTYVKNVLAKLGAHSRLEGSPWPAARTCPILRSPLSDCRNLASRDSSIRRSCTTASWDSTVTTVAPGFWHGS